MYILINESNKYCVFKCKTYLNGMEFVRTACSHTPSPNSKIVTLSSILSSISHVFGSSNSDMIILIYHNTKRKWSLLMRSACTWQHTNTLQPILRVSNENNPKHPGQMCIKGMPVHYVIASINLVSLRLEIQ